MTVLTVKVHIPNYSREENESHLNINNCKNKLDTSIDNMYTTKVLYKIKVKCHLPVKVK